MKTLIIVIVLALIVIYAMRSLIRHLKGEDECCGCSSKKSGQCHCNHKKY